MAKAPTTSPAPGVVTPRGGEDVAHEARDDHRMATAESRKGSALPLPCGLPSAPRGMPAASIHGFQTAVM